MTTHRKQIFVKMNEWLLFNANSAIFQLYHGENKLIFNEMMMKSAELDFYSASSLKQQSAGRHVAPLGHCSDSEPTSLWSFSFMLRAYRRSNKYQFYSLWFDPTKARTHDLPASALGASTLTITPPIWWVASRWWSNMPTCGLVFITRK
jgi:hypothetical protein